MAQSFVILCVLSHWPTSANFVLRKFKAGFSPVFSFFLSDVVFGLRNKCRSVCKQAGKAADRLQCRPSIKRNSPGVFERHAKANYFFTIFYAVQFFVCNELLTVLDACEFWAMTQSAKDISCGLKIITRKFETRK